MTKVPLIPFERPVPQAFLRAESKVPKAKKDKIVVSTKKSAAKPAKAKAKFSATNSEDISSKPETLQMLWRLMAKADPDGTLYVNDVGIIQLQGDVAPTRTTKALGFTDEETKMLMPYGVYDSDSPDDPVTARGVIFTGFQFLEMAYALGRLDEQAAVTTAMVAAADEEDDEGDADADVEEDIDDIDEEDLEEGVDGADDHKEDDEDFDDDEDGEEDD